MHFLAAVNVFRHEGPFFCQHFHLLLFTFWVEITLCKVCCWPVNTMKIIRAQTCKLINTEQAAFKNPLVSLYTSISWSKSLFVKYKINKLVRCKLAARENWEKSSGDELNKCRGKERDISSHHDDQKNGAGMCIISRVTRAHINGQTERPAGRIKAMSGVNPENCQRGKRVAVGRWWR